MKMLIKKRKTKEVKKQKLILLKRKPMLKNSSCFMPNLDFI